MEEEYHTLWGWEQLFSEVEAFLQEANRRFGNASPEYSEYVLERLGIVINAFVSILQPIREREEEELVELCTSLEVAYTCCRSLVSLWEAYVDDADSNLMNPIENEAPGFRVPRVIQGRGRPSAVVTREQLVYLRSMNFSWTHIAHLLGISRVTLFRRRRELGIQNTDILRPMGDDELRMFVGRIREDFPSIGESLVMARLLSTGYHVPRARVRCAIRDTNPINTVSR